MMLDMVLPNSPPIKIILTNGGVEMAKKDSSGAYSSFG